MPLAVWLLAALVSGIALVLALHALRDDEPWHLAKPKPATIRELGQVERPETHPCDFAYDCFDYISGWCQAPCDTYRVSARVVSIRRLGKWPTLWVVVLRDGSSSIAARATRKPRARVGDRVTVSGVLFFPRPRRDGRHAPNGAELSPVLTLSPQ